MGNESSTPVEEHVPPQTLESRSMEAVAKYIKEQHVQRIVVMVSAFVSHLTRSQLTRTDRRRHKHIGRHTRLSFSRYRPLCESGALESTLRRGGV